MELSIIIVSWQVQEKLKQNLDNLLKSKVNFDFEIFVVDNNSSDGTVEMVKNFFPQVKLISNQKNFGFAHANNQAFKLINGKYVLLLNPDMKVEENTLANMYDWLEKNPQASLASCCLVNRQGEVIYHVRRWPSLLNQLSIILKIPHLFPNILNKYLRKDFDYNLAQKVETVRGSFMMIRREALKEKLLDERYFIWFEDIDLCRTFKKANKEIWYTPVASCYDEFGASFAQLPGLKTQQYFRDSMLKYFKKWQPAWQYWLLWLAWWLGLAFSIVFGWAIRKNNT
jgi:hypothetical protein